MQIHLRPVSGGRLPRPKALWRFVLCAFTVCLAGALTPLAFADQSGQPTTEQSPQTVWAPPGTLPESDALAASQVTPEPENRPSNRAANAYVPSNFELARFRSIQGPNGETSIQENPLNAYVTGRDGLADPSTDDLMQWAAHKWGIPEDWIRALAVYESWWRQDAIGDLRGVSRASYGEFPVQARAPRRRVFEEMGINQIEWLPNETINPGTGRLRWLSTAFALDYMGATIRYYYDGDCDACGAGYSAGQQWASIAAWHAPRPWNNPAATSYISSLQAILAARTWTTPGFQHPCLPALSVGECARQS
ncbi:MAG: hypothetical protein ABSH51_16995 [Solirubrobacteraceae bacterium]|jgi:hypothetical protein